MEEKEITSPQRGEYALTQDDIHAAIVQCLLNFARRGRQLREERERAQQVLANDDATTLNSSSTSAPRSGTADVPTNYSEMSQSSVDD